MGVLITDWSKLGAVVRSTRRERGLSQADTARLAGVSRSWLARVEAGHRGAELEPLLRLLSALDLTLTVAESTASRRLSGSGHPPGDEVSVVGRHADDPTATRETSSAALTASDTAAAPRPATLRPRFTTNRHTDRAHPREASDPTGSALQMRRVAARMRRQQWVTATNAGNEHQ